LAVYFSGDEGDLLHIWLGYDLIALIAVRLVVALIQVKGFPTLWPALGSGVAVSATVSRSLVIALFLSTSATLTTGLLMVDNARILGIATTSWIAPAYADDDEAVGFGDEDRLFSSELEELHEIAANTTLVLAAIHIGFLLAFRRRFAINMIPGFGPAAKSRSGPVPKAASVSGASSA
jgi:3-ketosteroid 9alpha-monooxygenase subunit B